MSLNLSAFVTIEWLNFSSWKERGPKKCMLILNICQLALKLVCAFKWSLVTRVF